jgi:hypothetical protein
MRGGTALAVARVGATEDGIGRASRVHLPGLSGLSGISGISKRPEEERRA